MFARYISISFIFYNHSKISIFLHSNNGCQVSGRECAKLMSCVFRHAHENDIIVVNYGYRSSVHVRELSTIGIYSHL